MAFAHTIGNTIYYYVWRDDVPHLLRTEHKRAAKGGANAA